MSLPQKGGDFLRDEEMLSATATDTPSYQEIVPSVKTDIITRQIVVPKFAMALVIGKRGNNIKALKAVPGVDALTLEDIEAPVLIGGQHAEKGDGLVEVSGSQEAVQKVYGHIRDKIGYVRSDHHAKRLLPRERPLRKAKDVPRKGTKEWENKRESQKYDREMLEKSS